MIAIDDLPGLNAILNATAAVLLFTGKQLIERGRKIAHKRFMIAATIVSAVFLVSYLVHKFAGGIHYYPDGKPYRGLYLVILGTHVILAMVNVPLITLTLIAGLRDRIDRHKKLAKITYPSWMYVSVTGVVVYWMLYR